MTGTGREDGLPEGLAKPAIRALTAAGFDRLSQLANAAEAELAALHGMGPKAKQRLRDALAEQGLSFDKPLPVVARKRGGNK